MSALIVLIVVSIAVAGAFLGAFIWSVSTDQYDDREGASMRILFDEESRRNFQNK